MDSYFILTTDLHFTLNSISPNKENNLKIISKLASEKQITAVLIPGDLVDETNARIHIPKDKDELNNFLAWQKQIPIKNIYLSHGNHDTYVNGIGKLYLNQRVRTYLFFKYGWLDYHKTLIKDQLDLIALQCNPISKINIVKLLLKLCGNRKIIVMFHYDIDLRLPEFNANDRDKIMNILEPYKDQILFIAHGHVHANYTYDYNGFKIICGGGLGLALIRVKNGESKVAFISDIQDNNYLISMPLDATQVVNNIDDALFT